MTAPPASTDSLPLPPAVHRQRRALLALLLILILAAALRLYDLGGSSFWLDEFCSVECSTGRGLLHVALPTNVLIHDPPPLTTLAGAKPWWSIWTSMDLDNHPPLYFILLRFWRHLFGESDTAARSLSVLASLAAIACLFDAVRVSRDCAPAMAAWTALLMAVAMPQIHFAMEARGYSLLVALEAAACAALIRCRERGWNTARGLALFTCALAMLLTHYYAVAPLAALAIYAMISLRGQIQRRVAAALSAAALVFLFAWGPFFLQQMRHLTINNSYQVEPAAGHAALTFSRAAILPLRLLTESATAWGRPALAGAAIYLLPLLVLRRRRRSLLWYLIFLLPILLVVAFDLILHTKQTELIRYTLIAGPGLYALIAAAFAGRGRLAGHILPAAAALTCILTLPAGYSHDLQWPLLAEAVGSHARPQDVIIFASAGRDDWYAGALYLGVSHYAGSLPAPILLLTRPATPELMQRLHPASTLWLIAGSPDISPAQLLPGAVIRQRIVFPDVGALYELAAPL